jgi:hypothetical protein
MTKAVFGESQARWRAADGSDEVSWLKTEASQAVEDGVVAARGYQAQPLCR